MICQGWEFGADNAAGRSAVNRRRKRPEAGGEFHLIRKKRLSQETGEPLGPVSHGERL